jgi:predicted small metal-binding protein
MGAAVKLTAKTTVGLALPRGKSDHIYFDDDIPGFGVRVREGGSRSWVFQYRIGTKQRRMALGAVSAVPLGLARENAGKLAARVRLGGDPARDKELARKEAADTFGALVERYLETRKPEWRPRSYAEVSRHLTKHAKPLHGQPITAVSQRAISELLNRIARDSGDTTCNRVRASVSAFLSWVLREGIRLPEGNVASNTNKREERSRERVLADAELRAIWAACEADDYGAILKLLILTGQRANEIAGLRQDELGAAEIALPGERTKNAPTPSRSANPPRLSWPPFGTGIADTCSAAMTPAFRAGANRRNG